MLSDQDYIESVDLSTYLTQVISQLISSRPDNSSSFCKSFFDRLSSQSHVLGQSYATITSCRLNRRAFVKCCKDAFEGFSPTGLISTFDHAILIRALCPNIATALLHDVHFIITSVGVEQSRSYQLIDLNSGLYFMIIYEEWIYEMKLEFDESAIMKLSKLESTINNLRNLKGLYIDIPYAHTLENVINHAKTTFGEDGEISFDSFRRFCCTDKTVRDSLYLLISSNNTNKVAGGNTNNSKKG